MTRRRTSITASLAGVAVGLACAAWWSFATAGDGTLGAEPADALIVFGSPADISGAPTAMQTWRVHEAVAEYRRGAASHLVFAGGAAANQFVEADVMARQAVSLGVPPAAILTEGHSRTTIENLRGVTAVMQAQGWTTAELISSADHLPRIAVIAGNAPFRWRLHAAPTPGRGRFATAWDYAEEAAATLLLRTFGSAAEPVVHTVAVCEHWLLFLPKWIIWKLRHHTAANATMESRARTRKAVGPGQA